MYIAHVNDEYPEEYPSHSRDPRGHKSKYFQRHTPWPNTHLHSNSAIYTTSAPAPKILGSPAAFHSSVSGSYDIPQAVLVATGIRLTVCPLDLNLSSNSASHNPSSTRVSCGRSWSCTRWCARASAGDMPYSCTGTSDAFMCLCQWVKEGVCAGKFNAPERSAHVARYN